MSIAGFQQKTILPPSPRPNWKSEGRSGIPLSPAFPGAEASFGKQSFRLGKGSIPGERNTRVSMKEQVGKLFRARVTQGTQRPKGTHGWRARVLGAP